MESLRSSGMTIYGMGMLSAHSKRSELLVASRSNASRRHAIEGDRADAGKDDIPLGQIRVRRSIEMTQSRGADWDSGSETSRSKIVKVNKT